VKVIFHSTICRAASILLFLEYSRDLLKDVKDETSGHFKKMFVSLLQVNFKLFISH